MSIQKFCYLQEVLDQSTTHRKGCLCSPKAILTNRQEMPNNSAETETNFSEYPFCNDFTESSLDPAFHVGFGNWFYCPQMYHFPDSVLLGIWKVFQWKKKKKISLGLTTVVLFLCPKLFENLIATVETFTRKIDLCKYTPNFASHFCGFMNTWNQFMDPVRSHYS